VTRILLTNDDGFYAPGLRAMRHALEAGDDWEVVVVAPDREQSGASHALTLHRPVRLDEVDPGVYKVDGTPTDCVLVAVRGGLAEPPDVVVSGINAGTNMGDDVTYSGTVAAAMEGTLLSLPSIAVSLDGKTHFDTAATVAASILRTVLDRGLPADTLLNVNVPDVPVSEIQGVRVTTQSRRDYHDQVVRRHDPRGREYYWIAGDVSEWVGDDGSDYATVQRGYVSVTPLHMDLTNERALDELRGWPLDLGLT